MKVLETLTSLKKGWLETCGKGWEVAFRLHSFYMGMKRSLRSTEEESLPKRTYWEEEERWQRVILGYRTGNILVDQGVNRPEQFAEALKRQRELKKREKRKSLGVVLVEMGHLTSREYLEALSRYFKLPIISLLKFIPSPAVQNLLVNRYAYYNRLLVMADDGTEVKLALAEPDPLILEELKKTLKNREKVEFCLLNPFEIERCYRLYLDPYYADYCW